MPHRTLADRAIAFLFRNRWLVVLLESVPFIRRLVNRLVTNSIASSTVARPHPYSLWSPKSTIAVTREPYVSWTGLVDRAYTGRHLVPADEAYVARLPPA